MINHEHKFIFIHVPRTGGSSIEDQFNYREGREKNKHWTLYDWQNHLDKEVFNDYFKFTFVRNPWDIIISRYVSDWYSNKKRGVVIGERAGKSLEYFLEHYTLPKHEHGDSFFDYFDSKQMDFIGKFENRKQDLSFISNKIGYEISSDTHTRRNNKTKKYTEYYNDETRQLVAEKYAKDIERFGYTFGE
jgi:chondroitin 4-sulfotransferase 11